jgi:parallel beta-helix repeat protein
LDNTISNNKIGINVYGSTGTGINLWNENNTIKYNNITNNICGIYLEPISNIKIEKNNFISNIRHATFVLWFFIPNIYKWDSNYWNRPRILPKLIYGLNRAGLLYLPTSIPWINIDWRPASEPYDIP